MQPHYLEVRSTDDARADLARLAQADHCEANSGEVAERAQSLDACAQILDLGHGEHSVLEVDAARALVDVDKPVLVAVDERPQQDAAYQGEDGGVGADAERQREHYGDRESLGARERADGELYVLPEGHNGFGHGSCSLDFVATYAARRSRPSIQPPCAPSRALRGSKSACSRVSV